jgi:hypothetical protein
MGGDTILDYTAKPNGGLDARGFAVDPAFELTKDPWKTRLEALGASLPMQRGFAFLLDLANQFGPARVEQQYKLAAQPGVAEAEILKVMEDAFTAIARPQFQPQVRARREFFRTTTLL